MSKKETIEDQVKALSEREEKLKLQLTNDSDELRDKAKNVGKIALAAGLVTLIVYWIFNAFADEDDEEKPKKRKKNKKITTGGGVTSRLAALAVPYIEKLMNGAFDDSKKEAKEESKEN